MKRGLVLALLSIAIMTNTAFAGRNAGTVAGKVASEDGSPVQFANVLLFSVQDSTLFKAEYTHENGAFEMANIPAGSYWISISYVGMPDFKSNTFDVKAGETTQLTPIVMRASTVQLSEVTVVAVKPLVEVHADKTVFNVEGSINAEGNDALELLRKAPGLIVDNNENILMNGKSGIKVYIDGRPSHLSTQDLAAYLKTLQSSEIVNIEIITNPSSKYEAEGNAGIINIRLKKDKNLGANGRASVGYMRGRADRYNATFSGNYRNKTINTFGSYSYSDGKGWEYFNLYREQAGRSFDQRNKNSYESQTHNLRAGLDYTLNQFSTLGVLVNGYSSDYLWNSVSNTPIRSLRSETLDSTLVAQSSNDGIRSNYNFNLNYRFDNAKGIVLNLDVDYGLFRNDGSEYQPNQYFSKDGKEGSTLLSERIYANESPTDIDILTFKGDYERPVFGGKLAAGGKYSDVKTDNIFNFYNILEGNKVIDPDRTNRFVYSERIGAAYVNFSKQFGKIGLQTGLRLEHTLSDGILTALKETEEEEVNQSYTDFFPSAGITWQYSENHNFSLSYSRRINRPSYQDLNPFEGRLDELTFEKGNPFLTPQYSNSFQLNHTFMQMFNTSLSYSKTNDLITRVVDVDDRDSSASFITFKNLAKQNNIALSISSPVPVAKWWNANVNLTTFRVHNEADFGDGKTVDLGTITFRGSAQNTINLPADMTLEVSGWYMSPTVWEGTMKMNGMWAMDIGIQKKLIQGAGRLRLTLTDVFHTQKWSGESIFGALYMKANGNNDSRRLRLNFTYNFGNQQVKAARNRSTGLDDEAKRIKEGN